MVGLSENYISNLKNTADIIDIVSDYVALKRAGKNYQGLCPFHQEKTPSFSVSQDKQLYYCFGCGAGGDVISFLMDIENITFQESVKIIANRYGILIPDESPMEESVKHERDQLFAINTLAAKFYHYLLLNDNVAEQAREYLEGRGFSRADIERFQLGYAPSGWQSLYKFLIGRGYQAGEVEKAGLALISNNNSYYDRFRDRIIFPIFNIRGEVLAFGGRILNKVEHSPKYLNSPDTLIYTKGDNLYGLNWAKEEIRKTGNVIIMEGYTDVLSALQEGVNNAVASLGTALTINQARLLNRYASVVYIAYDADAAGANATLRGLDIIKETGLNVKVVQLPDKLDPDELIKKEGKESFAKLLDDSLSLLDFKIKQIIGASDISIIDERIEVTRQIINVLAEVKDVIERETYLHKIAEEFQLDLDVLKEELNRIMRNKDSKKKDKNNINRYTKKDNETKAGSNINKVERLILKIFIDYPETRNNITSKLKTDLFTYNQDLAQLLWRDFDSVQNLINDLQDEDIKKRLLSLAVTDIKRLRPDKIDLFINKFIYFLKSNINYKLQNNQVDLNLLNKLLLNFQQLSAIQRKEGY